MAKRNEPLDASLPSPPNASKTTSKKTPQVKKASLKGRFLFCLSFAALFLSIYALWKIHHMDGALSPLKTWPQHVESTQASLVELKQTLKANQEQVALLQQMMQTKLKQGFYQKEDWVALKARYYLELAQMNAYWSEENDSTIALLQQADTLLATLADPRYTPVREAIAHDITQLQANPVPDLIGILTKLNALQTAIKDLPVHSIDNQPSLQPPANISASTESAFSWRLELQKSLAHLKKLVVVHHDTDKTAPLLPKHRALLQDMLLLNLQEAQWAVLHHNPAVYQLVLQQAINSIHTSFDEQSPITQNLLQQLTQLHQIPLTSARPSVKQPLVLLNAIIDEPQAAPKTKTPAEDTP